jgi:DNA replication factor GINS
MTYEDLSAAYRAEMKSATLTDVRKDLYQALVQLQECIRKEYEDEYTKDPDSIMCEGKNERRKKAVSYVQKVIDLRMEKIAKMALRTSMGADNALDKLTKEERGYYDSVVDGSKRLRAMIHKDAKRNYVIPDISSESTGTKHDSVVADAAPVNDVPKEPDTENEGEELIESPHKDDEPHEDRIMVRILEDLPTIAGPDRDYDLKREEVLWMPAALAKALINHDKAVISDVTP